MNKSSLGVLIHGAGWVSTQHIAAFTNNPHTHVAAISSRRIESARQRAEEAGLTEVGLYDDLDAALQHEGVDIVCVCTPQQVHCENVIAAARAGKHIVIEKPAANSLDELRRMREAVNAAGVKTVVSFVLRWNPMIAEIKQLIAGGTIGEVACVETDYQSYNSDWWDGWEMGRRKDLSVSALAVAGCHAVDTLRWFAAAGENEAADPVEVFAYAGGKRKGQTRDQFNPLTGEFYDQSPMEYDGIEMVLVKFSNGVIGKVSANFEAVQPYTFPLDIFGDRGTIKNNQLYAPQSHGQEWTTIPGIRPDSSDVSHHPFQGQIDHFVDCICHDVESHCNLGDAIKTHEIVFAAQECYRTNQPVKLPLI